MAARKIRRYFTQQDFLDGKCDRNGIALVGKGLHTEQPVVEETPVNPVVEPEVEPEAVEEIVDEAVALTAKQRAQKKFDEEQAAKKPRLREPTFEVPKSE